MKSTYECLRCDAICIIKSEETPMYCPFCGADTCEFKKVKDPES